MGLVNFRVSDELKKIAFEKISELGKTPSDVFKGVMQYIVNNGKLPYQEVVMSNQDLMAFNHKIVNNSLNQKLFELFQEERSTYQISLSGDTGSGATQGIISSIEYFISKGSGCLIAHPSICQSESDMDRLLSTSTLYNREVKILNLKNLHVNADSTDHYYNPLRGKSFDNIAFMAMKLSPQSQKHYIDVRILYKLSLVISPKISVSFDGNNRNVSFENLEKWAQAYIEAKTSEADNHKIELQAANLILEGCQVITQTSLGTFTNHIGGDDDKYFILEHVFNHSQVGLIESSFDKFDNVVYSLFKEVFSLDFMLIEYEYGVIKETSSLFVNQANFLIDTHTLSIFLRTARKSYITSLISIPEVFAYENPEQHYIQILQLSTAIFIFNTHQVKESLNNYYSQNFDYLSKYFYKLSINDFAFFSYRNMGQTHVEIIKK